ncbi:MAG: hypothetical protein JXP73_19910 [Deltaproteobacteria bacterium]|nr:hypothetical protein [Deltaproteobacteria bacterium]
MRAKAVCLLTVLHIASVARAEATDLASAPERPWERSVRLERAGDLRAAEAVLVEAWGKHPDNYYAQLRLAYLALVTKRANAALARYKRARRFPEARDDADAKAGYAAALALKGWKLTRAGKTDRARVYFRRALAVEPKQPDALSGLAVANPPKSQPELWGALVGQSFGSALYQGLAVFAQLPWRFWDRLTVRLAGRHIEWRQTSTPPPWASPEHATGWTVNEIYGGAGYDTPTLAAEGLAFALASSGSPALAGAGLKLRYGRQWGAFADLAALRSERRFVNLQLRPAAFLAVGDHVLLYAGARLTREQTGQWTSLATGGSLWLGAFAAHLQGHLGTEHWAANLASPSLLSIAPHTRGGASLTATYDVIPVVRLAGQAEACAIEAEGATGMFWSLSLGLQLRYFGS